MLVHLERTEKRDKVSELFVPPQRRPENDAEEEAGGKRERASDKEKERKSDMNVFPHVAMSRGGF